MSKQFGSEVAVNEASFELAAGRFLTILGPSGCGKTTLLRMIAGFITPDAGHIELGGVPVDSTPPHKRSIGMVFQRLALFPHLDVARNVAYPLKMRGFPRSEIARRVEEYLAIARLQGFAERRIHELSGGQQQRVAIARALVFEPDLLLLDEPLSALDRKLREEMQLEFRRIQRRLGVTTINVTHDQREALVMSDEVIVMRDGLIEQNAPPVALYRQPANRFVAGFVGLTTFLRGEVVAIDGTEVTLRAGATELRGRNAGDSLQPGAPVECALRAEQITLVTPDRATTPGTVFDGTVREAVFEGDRMLYEVLCESLGETPLYVFDHDPLHHRAFEVGEPVRLGWNANDLLVFPAST